MKKIRLYIYVISGILIGVQPSLYAQTNANATAHATIIAPLSIVNNHNLSFGSISPSGTAGTAVMSVSSTNVTSNADIFRTPTTDGNCTAANSGNVAAGRPNPELAIFTVQGEAGMFYNIVLPSPTTPIPIHLANTDNNSAPDMLLDNLTCVWGNPGTMSNIGQLNQGLAGNKSFLAVGGTLHVPANAIIGFYSGTFNVAVSYQ
jgi:hypothetical protein